VFITLYTHEQRIQLQFNATCFAFGIFAYMAELGYEHAGARDDCATTYALRLIETDLGRSSPHCGGSLGHRRATHAVIP
jgi:hypothetical protein